jgi:glycosyltransferase involved in cell wall biosynthesis
VIWNIRCGKPDPAIHKRATYWTSRACAAASSVTPARIICCSQAALEGHAAAGYDRSKMVVVPNGFDTAAFRPDARWRVSVRNELGLPAEALLIGMIARFDAAKDHATFCRAAAIVSRANPHVHFVLCGPQITAGNRALMSCVEEVGIAQRCHLLGPRSDVPRLMASLDILVSSSLVEGFSNVLGEAMSSAVPCVATDVGDSRLIVGDTGYVVPVRAPELLARNVMAMIEMGTERRTLMGAAARRRVTEKFSLAAAARKYEMTYEELASQCAA